MSRRSRRATRKRVLRARRAPPGAPPGTLISDPHALHPVIRVFAYGPEDTVEREVSGFSEVEALRGRYPVLWVNVDGLADVDLIRRFGDSFGLHGLALEDVVNVHQRPKVDDYGAQTFIVTRMPAIGDHVDTEQVSMFLGDGYLLTFQERPGDCFDPVRERIRARGSRMRQRGADYLAYALLDTVIDAYYPVLEAYGEEIEALEIALTERVESHHGEEIHAVKRDLLTLRRAIWPQREMVNALIRDPSHHFAQETTLYLRDCYDHTIQLLDVVETYREIASGLVDLYLSAVSTRMNEIMKLLTIIATIFIPLGFVASLYGMNFDRQVSPFNMPELGWRWGYPYALGLMAAIAAGLLVYFRHKGWLGSTAAPRRPPKGSDSSPS